MIILCRTILGLIFVVSAIDCCFAREWRGITPMRSTRSDVIRLLNQCSENKEACKFSWAAESVYILFAGGVTDDCEGVTRIDPETVMFIEVVPKTKLKFKDLRLVRKNLNPVPKIVAFNNKLKGYRTDDGLLILGKGDEIYRLAYVSSAKEGGVCADYFSDPEPFIQTSLVHPPPSVNLDCPPSEIKDGTILTLRAYYSPIVRRGFEWSVSTGKILSGQLTKKLVVDTTGLAGKTVVVTAEMDDGLVHRVVGSCSLRIGLN
jgi:hypothetical protein